MLKTHHQLWLLVINNNTCGDLSKWRCIRVILLNSVVAAALSRSQCTPKVLMHSLET